MNPLTLRALVLALPLVAILHHGTSGQAVPNSDAVPRELVLALLGGPGADILIGRMPDDLPHPIELPEGARVVGSLVRPEQSTIVTIVAILPLSPDEALASIRQTLTSSGWSAAPEMPGTARVFLPDAPERWEMLCAADVSLTMSAWDAGQGESFARIGYSPPRGGFSPCNPPPQGRMPGADAPLPSLRAPEGVRTRPAGMSTSNGIVEATLRVESSMPSPELARHYASQMREQDWMLQAEAATKDLVVQSWRLQEAGGRVWHALLLVGPLATSAREVVFRMSDPSVMR